MAYISAHYVPFSTVLMAERKTITSKSFFAFIVSLCDKFTHKSDVSISMVGECVFVIADSWSIEQWISETNELKNNKQWKSLENALMCPLDDDMCDVASLSIFHERMERKKSFSFVGTVGENLRMAFIKSNVGNREVIERHELWQLSVE